MDDQPYLPWLIVLGGSTYNPATIIKVEPEGPDEIIAIITIMSGVRFVVPADVKEVSTLVASCLEAQKMQIQMEGR